jgi:cysteine desulfurase/selenocysteine lyase
MSSLSLPEAPVSPLDVQRIREDFPILRETAHGKPIVYLDNAASTQKPRQVIDALVRHYEHDNANVHRGIHELSNRATDAYDGARARVAALFGIADPAELIWTRGTTRSCSPCWSTTATWCPGRSWPGARARGCAFWRSTTRGGWTCRGWTRC